MNIKKFEPASTMSTVRGYEPADTLPTPKPEHNPIMVMCDICDWTAKSIDEDGCIHLHRVHMRTHAEANTL